MFERHHTREWVVTCIEPGLPGVSAAPWVVFSFPAVFRMALTESFPDFCSRVRLADVSHFLTMCFSLAWFDGKLPGI